MDKFSGLNNHFEKSLAVNKILKALHVLRFEDMAVKKAKGLGMEASKYEEVIGMVLKKSYKAVKFYCPPPA